MAAGVRLITLALWMVALCAGAVLAGESGCLNCHPVHYRDKGSCVACHRGRPDTQRREIAHHRMIPARFAAFTLDGSPVVEQGRTLLKGTACRRCHVSGGTGNGLAANLDRSLRNATPEELYTAIQKPAFFMPDFHYSEAQLIALVNAIQTEALKVPPSTEEVPLMIHFEDPGQREESTFQKECGTCHRALSRQQGSLGAGIIGPNLSGLLTEFYPQTHPEAKAWSVKGLEDWLKNPRKLLKNARMQPVKLKTDEWQRLQRELLEAVSSHPVPN